MTTTVRKVDGGYELTIPDQIATAAGFAAGMTVEVDVMAEMLLIRQPEFVAAARQAANDAITPETLHGEDDWGVPVGRERVAE